MKKPKFIRLRLLLGLTPGKSRRRGVAIITVLAVVSLMTILIISFFQMAQTAKTTASGTVEMQRVVGLKDIITNYVTGQIRIATTLSGGSNTQTLWTSQPGAIRTYHSSLREYNRLYKLYSSDKMLITAINPDSSAGTNASMALLGDIENDIDPRWDEYPDMFTDLNRPVRSSLAEKDSDSPAQIKHRLIYPIADPSRYNGQDSAVMENTEGFSYGEHSLSSRAINGVDNKAGQLAMPVRWIYLLEDGTTGTLDKEGKFAPLTKDGSEPTKENPIVSRLAWWTDDESCKINVNTASVPVPWDTPRTTSSEDLWYAQHQPVSGECQHYPGHPAQTDLSAVFFPGYRYVPDAAVFPVGEAMKILPDSYAQLLWNICPFITETGGSAGGKTKVNILSAAPVPLDNDDHLYATFEELYFKTKRAEKNLNRARDTVARDDQSGRLLERLEASQFFLTTRSNSPEITNWGTPKVCMFPMNEQVVAEVGKPSGLVNPQVGAFEVTMATNCTIGAAAGRLGKAFYFQRALNSNSRHNNFYTNVGGRNARLFKYLKKLTIGTPPGYPEMGSTVYDTFAKKYPSPAPAGISGAINSDFDDTDRTQILVSILDLMRSSNMAPGYLESGSSYDNGNGQVSGICGCNTINPANVQQGHTAALVFTKKAYTPKGSGRTYGAAEFLFFANVIAYRKGPESAPQGRVIVPDNPDMRDIWENAKGSVSLVQAGVLMNSFSPRQGWASLYSESGINLSTEANNGPNDPRTNGANNNNAMEAPFVFAKGGAKPFFLCANLNGLSSASTQSPNGCSVVPGGGDPPITLAQGFVPWAGIGGCRVSASRSVATFDTFAYEGDGAGGTGQVTVQLQWKKGKVLRVFLYDGPPDAVNTIQAIDLELGPPSNEIKIMAAYTGKSIHEMMQETITRPANDFPPYNMQMVSFVVPHGDYRLTTTPLRVDAGIYVKHKDDRHCSMEPVISGLNITYLPNGNAAGLSGGGQGLLEDNAIVFSKANYTPHFAPVHVDSVAKGLMDPGPNVTKVASSVKNKDDARVLRMAHGRRDGQNLGNKIPNRGSSDPLETGDFDNGVGLCPDGPYMNQPDDGDARDVSYPYYKTLDKKPQVNPAAFSPNRLFRSAVDFGSIPSGMHARVPWQTLRFRPDPGMNHGDNLILKPSDQPEMPQGYQHYFPFSNYCGPKDHLLLDMLWMPVVEPWSISEGFATKGQINLNQQIFPFTYIKRLTALHALLRSERMMAIPDEESNNYKNGAVFPHSTTYRHWINAKETLRQLTEFRWRGQDCEGFTIPFNSFRSASEICELWLVPEKNGVGNESGQAWDLNHMWNNNGTNKSFWEKHRLTGDNMRERPYANLYPRLTVRSNVYKVHMIAQTLKKASTNEPETFVTVQKEGTDPDLVTAEWRGSALIERVLNPNEPELQNFDYAPEDNKSVTDNDPPGFLGLPKLDSFYTYRVTEVKQFTE